MLQHHALHGQWHCADSETQFLQRLLQPGVAKVQAQLGVAAGLLGAVRVATTALQVVQLCLGHDNAVLNCDPGPATRQRPHQRFSSNQPEDSRNKVLPRQGGILDGPQPGVRFVWCRAASIIL